MSEQRHIINKQVLEIQMPANANVQQISADLSRICREKLIPIIGELCDRLSPPGTLTRIDSLSLDLGNFRMEEMEEVFAEKFAEALAQEIETQTEVQLYAPEPEEKPASRPLALLAWYLQNGIMPWWAPDTSKKYLEELLADLNAKPDLDYRALLLEVGRKKAYRERFVSTFSEESLVASLRILGGEALNGAVALRQQLQVVLAQQIVKTVPGRVIAAYWAAVFAHLSTAGPTADLPREALRQGLMSLDLDREPDLRDLLEEQDGPPSAVKDSLSPEIRKLQRDLGEMQRLYQDSSLLQAFCRQMGEVLAHPLLKNLSREEIRILGRLFQDLSLIHI